MGTLFVDKLDPQSGTSLEIGSSGDTITIPSGATITNNGTATNFGISSANTPAFAVSKSASQTITNNTSTKITFDTEYLDTASAFASNKFTCPAGQAGNYIMKMSLLFYKNAGNYIKATELAAYKNGGPLSYGNDLGPANHSYIADTSDITQIQAQTSFLVTLAENDYVECYGKAITVNSGNPSVYNYYTSWHGFKIT
jgi:hypothetical protein